MRLLVLVFFLFLFVLGNTNNSSSTGGEEPSSSGLECNCSCPTTAAATEEPIVPVDDHANEEWVKNAKYSMIPVLFTLTLGGSYAPYAVRKLDTAADILSVAGCFASGVMLGTTFSHMIPHAFELWDEWHEANEAAHEGETESEHEAHAAEEHAHSYPFVGLIIVGMLLLLISIEYLAAKYGLGGSTPGLPNHGHSHAIPDLHTHSSSTELAPSIVVQSPASVTVTPAPAAIDAKPAKVVDPITEMAVSRAWVFCMAMILHSVADGLAIGTEDNKNSMAAIVGAMIVHKLMDGFSLGTAVYVARFPWWQDLLMLGLSATTTPLGIAIGLGATSGVKGNASKLAQAIILSISAGTFLFISLVELLPACLARPKWTEYKLAAAWSGWAILALIAKWA